VGNVRVENKVSLVIYAMGALGGIISGVLSANANLGYVSGLLLYFLTPKVIKATIKDLPGELKDDRALLRRSVWGFLLFWFYFTILVYNIVLPQQPVFYSNQSLLYNATKG